MDTLQERTVKQAHNYLEREVAGKNLPSGSEYLLNIKSGLGFVLGGEEEENNRQNACLLGTSVPVGRAI